MARLEIEERAWSDSKLRRLALTLDIPNAYALGLVATLWHDSQNELKSTCTMDDLKVWFSGFSEDEIDKILSAFLVANYLKVHSNSEWKISGNRSKISKVRAYKKRAKNAAEIRWTVSGKRDIPESDQEVPGHATSNAYASTRSNAYASAPSNAYIIQHTTRQQTARRQDDKRDASLRSASAKTPATNERVHDALARVAAPSSPHTDPTPILDHEVDPWDEPETQPTETETTVVYEPEFQAEKIDEMAGPRRRAKASRNDKTTPRIEDDGSRNIVTRPRKKNATASKETTPTGINEVVGEYCRAYKQRYGDYPPTSGATKGAARTLTRDYGVEKAKVYVEAFLRMNSAYYVEKRHPLTVCLADINKVAGFASKGVEITRKTAQNMERVHNNDLVANRVIEYYKNKENTIDV